MTEVDATAYPKTSVNFSAFDYQDKPYTNLQSSDFTIWDNGLIVPSTLINIDCTTDAPYNVVIVIDKSSSMKDNVDGKIKWDWAVEGVQTFVANVPFGDSSKMALVSFAGSTELLCDFTKNKQDILDSLKKIPEIYGNTNYNVAFLDENYGAINLLKNQNPNYKRAIVFLSDGEHSNITGAFQLEEVSKQLREYNIQLFAITLLSTKNNDLELLARRTGGYYDFVDTKVQLNNLYSNFASRLQIRQICKLEWESPDICDELARYRTVNIKFNKLNITNTRAYVAPEYSIINIETDQQMYDFGNPEVGNYEDRDIIITPKIKNFTAKNIKIIPSDYFEIIDWGDGTGTPPKYDLVLPVDIPRTIKVRFNQKIAKKIRKATLILEGEPCSKEISLVGGYHRMNITNPLQGNSFSQCDDINIQWNGNEPDVQLDLYYTIDNGATWNNIIRKFTGYSYKWKSPIANDNIKIKIETTPGYEYEFAHSFGGSEDDISTSLCITPNGLYHYVTGYFSGEMNIGPIKLVSRGKEDIFIAKFDSEGNTIWAKNAGTIAYDDRANGIVTDNDGYVYITGVTYKGVVFDNFTPILPMDNTPYFFVAKFNQNGDYVDSRYIGATSDFPDFKTRGTKIGFDYQIGQLPKIYMEGKYTGEYIDYNLESQLPLTLKDSTFSLSMSTNLDLLELYATTKNWNYTSKKASYLDEATYETNTFSNNIKIDKFNLTSNGKTDFWVSKYAKLPQSIDISGAFSIIKQKPVLTINDFSFGEVVFSDSATSILEKVLYNPYKVPVKITGFTIKSNGTANNDYKLISDITGTILKPNDSINLVIMFKPTDIGQRNAWLEISSTCENNIKLNLLGVGTCGGSALELYDFGDQNLKKSKKDTIYCAFKNISSVPLVVYPLIRGTNYGDFTLEIPSYYKVVNGKITMNPGECLDLIVSFSPKELGERTANINFNIDKPCKNSIIELKGTGISADISFTSYDWGAKRIKGNYPAQINIKNNSDGNEIIDSIRFVDPNYDKSFDLKINTSEYPKPIKANSTISIDVQYNPLIEQTDHAEIYCYINSRVDPIIAKLDGIGILPKMIATWNCGNEVNVGDTTIANLTIENPSNSSDLNINKIEFEDQMEEFTFLDTNDIKARIVKMGEKISIPVIFTPRANSTNSNIIDIYADDYDGTYQQEWKITKVSTSCDGIQLVYNDIDYGNTIICSNNIDQLVIKNNSKSNDVTLYLSKSVFSEHSDLFKLTNLQDKVISGGQSVVIPITFQSSELGNYSTKLTIPNSANYKIEVNLSANTLNYTPSTTLKTSTQNVADIFSYPVDIKIPDLKSGKLDSIKLTLKYDPYVIKYKENSIVSELQNVNWQSNYIGNGELEITGIGSIASNQQLTAFKIEFITLLNDKHKTEITVTSKFDCKDFGYELSTINVNPICFNDNRIIQKSSKANFALKDITPNPITENTTISFGVGFEVGVQIQLYDMNGNTISNLVNETLPSGNYEAVINTKELNNGLYFIKMVAGPFSETKKLMIAK